MIIFSVVDFNSFIHPEWELDILAWNNDTTSGVEYWRRVLMSLSGAASFTGAMCVVLTTFGKLSCYFWGTINCILYGLFAFAYGYGGDAQLNIVFFLPMQFWGILTWKDHIDESNENTVQGRSLKIWEWILTLCFGVGIYFGFYYEIPKFVEAVGGEYLFYDNDTARILDAATNSLNIIGQLLSLYRFWEQWFFWITVDCLQIAMYAGIAGFGINFNILFMWCLFLTNALFGLALWVKRLYDDKKKKKYLKKLGSNENFISKEEDKKYKTGLIIDFFYPLTQSHHEFINKACNKCEKVYIVICERNQNEFPKTSLRRQWIEEIHQGSSIHKILIGKLVSDDIKDIEKFMMETIFDQIPKAEAHEFFQMFYSSENHGRLFLNALLGVTSSNIQYEFKLFDTFSFQVQNGKIICDKKNYLDLVHPVCRKYYVPRIVLLGPESCGKTTLAKKLAEYYDTPWVKEYGHDYCEEKLKNQPKSEIMENDPEVFYQWTDDDFIHISSEQSKLEDNLVGEANRFLICDTDSFTTNIWYERYMNKRLESLEDIHKVHAEKVAFFFYFLFNPKGLPFVQDGTRDGEKIREWMFDLFKKRLNEENKLFFVVAGTYDEMENQIKKHIQEMFYI